MSPWLMYRAAGIEAAHLAAYERELLSRAVATGKMVLGVHECPGDVLGLGRFHTVPDVDDAARVSLHRRMGGGRPVPLGEGFVGVTLALPDRAAFATAGAAPLAAERLLNRAVRGVLGALEGLGVSAYYAGRDVITVGGRTIGALTLQIEPGGAIVVELLLAADRTFATISAFLDRADRAGVIPADVVLPADATSITEELGRTVTFDALAEALRAGYAARLDAAFAPAGDPLPAVHADAAWLEAARLAPRLDRHAGTKVMLGWLQAHVAVANGRIEELRLTGDVIASAATVARIEERCRGLVPERSALVDAVRSACAGADDFVLGVRPLEVVADVVLRACEQP
jgi:lipoate-protein ligase A